MYLASYLALTGFLAGPASAFWRLPCVTPIVQERADPIVNPGQLSGHLHTIMGGNAFDFTMDGDTPYRSTCSSCTVQGDLSNYWTPVLFVKNPDGTFEKVNQLGGATVYYLQRNANGEKITAFPKGFRMLAGDPFKRTGGTDAKSQAISYNCLDYKGGANPETGGFPSKNCPNGIRSQVFFPSCWDGKNLDSSDHMSHVSYPEGAYNAGKCPSSHPVRLMSLFYEIIWDTNKYANLWSGSSHPFVWSMGDPTGYGFHGDFINGWDVALLQKAADQCTNLSGRVEDCQLFKLTSDSTASGCRIASKVNDVLTGKLPQLPGCNPIQAGPARATVQTTGCSSNAKATIQQPSTSAYYTDLTSKGWAYAGCATDNYYSRSMSGATTSNDAMTNEACTAFCQSKGFKYAGSEYARECYCGNSFPSDRLPVAGTPGNCDMACKGNSTQWCGGAGKMSLYKKCEGGACTNADIGLGASGSGSASGSSGVSALASTTRGSPSSKTTTAAARMTRRAEVLREEIYRPVIHRHGGRNLGRHMSGARHKRRLELVR